jgi:hypothetical protein
MKVECPADHGSVETLREEREVAVVRPRRHPGDTYPSLWFWFRAFNDGDRPIRDARIVVEQLRPGHDSYEPFWKHCLWSAGGECWERIPSGHQSFGETSLTVHVDLEPGEGRWIAETFPLPYSHHLRKCAEWSASPPSGLEFRRLALGESVEGRPLVAFQVRRPGSEPGAHLLLLAGQHAVEQSGKLFAETVLDGYHSGRFDGTVMARLLETHGVTVVPLANPDGCYAGRMNTNAVGVVVDDPSDNSVETLALLELIDALRPRTLVNCHGWANKQGTPPYEDLYRWTDDDPIFAFLREHLPGCNTSAMGHWLADRFRLECHARERHGTECLITELNWNSYLPPDGGPERLPTLADLQARSVEYFTAISRYLVEHAPV